MAKKRRKKRKTLSSSRITSLIQELKKVRALIEEERYVETLPIVQQLRIRAPYNVEVFQHLFFLGAELGNPNLVIEACEKLTTLEPNEPLHFINLFAGYSRRILPALALQTAEYVLGRWPQHEEAKDLRERVSTMRTFMAEEAQRQKLPLEKWLEISILHDKVQLELEKGEYQKAISLATELLEIAPEFVPAYNNRAMAHFLEGDLEACIADGRRGLALHPENVHALGNVVRGLWLQNRRDEAREFVQNLESAPCRSEQEWAKKLEVFSLLADDATVLKLYEEEKGNKTFYGEEKAGCMHYAAVAAARLGREDKARQLWREALEIDPTLEIARANLDDLDKPIDERPGPWPFGLESWMPPALLSELKKSVKKLTGSKISEAVRGTLTDFMNRYPGVAALAPTLLERGDDMTRMLFLEIAKALATPEMFEILKDFGMSANGPASLRHKTLLFLQEMGVIEEDASIETWSEGGKREVLLHNYQIDMEPYCKTKPQAVRLMDKAVQFMRQGLFDQARSKLERAKKIDPNSAIVQYNFALCELQAGNYAGGKAMLEKLAKKYPDYALPQCQLAIMAIANEDYARAKELLSAMSRLKRFHYQEFSFYIKAQCYYFIIAETDAKAASSMLDVLEKVMPEDGTLSSMRPLLRNVKRAQRVLKKGLEPLRDR